MYLQDERKTMSVFQVMRLVRDARSTKGAQRQLLMALALRCNPKKKFICWPSYRVLAEDTLLDPMTLKRAAKKLEDGKLIKRSVRSNHSNVWWVNVALLEEQAAEVKAAANGANEPSEDDCPFQEPAGHDGHEPDSDEATGGDDWNRGGAR